MKIIGVILTFFIVISLASAIDPGQQNSPLPISHSVRVNGGLPSGASCNITIFNPRSNLLVPFQAMTYNSSSQTFDYTLPANQTSITGDYCYDITCQQGALNSTDSFCVPVTPSGTEPGEQESSIYIFVGLLAIFIFLVFTFLFFKIDGKNKSNPYGEIVQVNYMKQFKIICGLIAYMTLVWVSYIAWGISYTYLEFAGIAKGFYFVHRMLFVFSYLIIFVYMFGAIVLFWQDKKVKALIDRGFIVEDKKQRSY